MLTFLNVHSFSVVTAKINRNACTHCANFPTLHGRTSKECIKIFNHINMTLSISVYVSLSLSVSLCLSVSLYLPVCLSLSLFLFLSLSLCASVYLCVSVCLWVSLCVSVCLSNWCALCEALYKCIGTMNYNDGADCSPFLFPCRAFSLRLSWSSRGGPDRCLTTVHLKSKKTAVSAERGLHS